MSTDQSFDKLENILRDTGTHVAYPATPSIAHQVNMRLRAERSRVMLVRIATATAIILILGMLMIPENRTTIGGWLGLNGAPTAFRLTPTLSMTAQTGTFLAPTTVVPLRTGTPASWCPSCENRSPDIRLLVKPVAQPIESIPVKQDIKP